MNKLPDNGFVDDESTLGWVDDENGEKLAMAEDRLRRAGFSMWPSHVPAPIEGYDYQFYGALIYSRPACSRWHRFFFRLPSRITDMFL